MKWNRWVVRAGLRHDKADASGTRTFPKAGESTLDCGTPASATTGRVGAVYLFDSGWGRT